MSGQKCKQVERLAVRGAMFSVLASSLVIGLLIWGKLQLKEVPRTAERCPIAMQSPPHPLH